MKLAHLILAHNNPLQLERMVKRLYSPKAYIFIYLDLKADMKEFENICKLPNVQFIKNRIYVGWGNYSIIEATLIGMKEILATGINFSHINLLSGNDYPLKSASEIEDYFFANTGKTFMWYDKIFNDWPDGQVRMQHYSLADYNFKGRYHVAKLLSKILPARKLPENYVAYGRAQWLTITPECASYVIDFIEKKSDFRRYFKMTWCVDEVFFQTILCNSPLAGTIVNDFRRYVLLDPGCKPITLTMAHAEDLISSGKFYARKFDANIDSAILDFLDTRSVRNVD